MAQAARRGLTRAKILEQAQLAFRAALRSERRDYRGADEAQKKRIKRNVAAAEALWYKAGVTILDATAARVAEAYALAIAASADIDEARAAAMAIPERIRKTAGVITAVNNLIKAAKKKPA
jgi:hypothetical protein